MPQPFVVIVPHQLGRRAARDRLERGLDRIRSEVAAFATVVESNWIGDRLTFLVRSIGQTIGGRMDVLEDAVRVEVDLPWIMTLVAEKIVTRIQQTGARLLR
jgi:Putative polyhydroxyalkanoic acid system protein (PHA_gran_rgn)